jgi:3-hydroxyisobutyrate dehydrogenase-like beta-hydroxyacid dehydrogenase
VRSRGARDGEGGLDRLGRHRQPVGRPHPQRHELTLYNRTATKADARVRQHGATTAATPAEAARDAEFVLCCLGNGGDLRQVTLGETGAFQAVGKGAVFIDNTTPPGIHFAQRARLDLGKVTETISKGGAERWPPASSISALPSTGCATTSASA